MEIWKDIIGYENMYYISNYGNVKNNKILMKNSDCKGALKIRLTKDKIHKSFYLHRLVAIHFMPNPDNKPKVFHKDGNAKNNHVDNLIWGNDSDERQLKKDRGYQHTINKEIVYLTVENVIEIKKLLKTNKTMSDIAKIYNTHRSNISDIRLNKKWAWITYEEIEEYKKEIITVMQTIHGDKYLYLDILDNKITFKDRDGRTITQTIAEHKKYKDEKLNKYSEYYYLFKNKEDIINIGNMTAVDIVCPDCGFESLIKLNYIKNFKCIICSDGITLPNKFITNILTQLDVSFKTEKTFTWSEKRRYDFYIEGFGIIEVHGLQHYEEVKFHKDSIRNDKEIDKLKRNLAKSNNIENYIEIDARKSDLIYLKEQTIISLSEYFDLTHIDWEIVYKNCSKSYVSTIWNMWNEGSTVLDIIKHLKLGKTTIIEYLIWGNNINKVMYPRNPKTKMSVDMFALDGTFIKTFDSINKAHLETGLSNHYIKRCCEHKVKKFDIYKWEFSSVNNITY